MNSKPTHQLRTGGHEDVTAWQFSRTAPIPVWVARRFHIINQGDAFWSAIQGEMVVTASPGDWAVTDGERIFVLNDAEFQNCFTAYESAKR